MTRWSPTVPLALALGAATWAPISAQQPTPVPCTGVIECRAQAEAAIAQGDYERAHDLAWRTVQQETRSDPALMYLLARTQALSGRPDDALVMLRRLAEFGVAPDASIDEFRPTRGLPGWPAVETLIEGVKNRIEPLEPREPLEPIEPIEPLERAVTVEGAVVEGAGSFSSLDFAPGGFACDAVSGRYVFGDRPGRKLQILAEGADHSIDLTRALPAGFLNVMALDIDTTNGTLWVASAEADGRAATLHRLQLISGRALASYAVPDGLAPARLLDVAVTASGAVLLLDAAKGRVLVLRSRTAAIEVLTILQPGTPTSITVGSRDGVAYVAHQEGLARIDLRSRAVVPLSGPDGTPLSGIEGLRRYGTSLVGVQTMSDGVRRLVRLLLDASGRRVTALKVIDVPMPPGGAPIFMAVCGDTLALLAGEAGGTSDLRATVWTVRQVRLRR